VVLVEVVDCAAGLAGEPDRDPVADLDTIEAELAAYADATGADLGARPRIVALNKIDIPAAREVAGQARTVLAGRGLEVHEISAATHEGVREFTFAVGRVVAAARAAAPPPQPTRRVIRPPAAGGPEFDIVRVGENSFLVRGHKPARWVRQTDFSNAEAVGYLGDRLARIGVEKALAEAGGPAGGAGGLRGDGDPGVFGWGPGVPARTPPRFWPRRARRKGAPGPGDGAERDGDRGAGPGGGVGGQRGPPAAATGGQPGQRGTPADERGDIATARRVVVKVGSSSLTTEGRIDDGRIAALAGVLAARVNDGSQVVLVSSGAIAAGLTPLRLARRPRDLATQQAAASVGQGLLVAVYTAAFARHGIQAGQILLTADDLMRRAHYRNAQRTLGRLLELGVLPVVNENDTVATDEIRFGDNDRLAALVAHVVRAGALILLSDVDGLYDFDPRHPGARRISRVEHREDLDSFVLGPP